MAARVAGDWMEAGKPGKQGQEDRNGKQSCSTAL